ncbi:MAG: type I pullulanase, partial [Lachnospiraceae bacterium]|nr:type I pullulanase [Lachnospiraceae bacterium]
GYVTDENGAVAEVTVTPGTQEFGYIIRKGGDSWEAKDWDGDRFVNVDGYISGTVHVYLKQGVEVPEIDYSKAVAGEYVEPEHDGLVVNFFIDKTKEGNWGLWLWDDVGTAAIFPYFEANEEGKLTISYNVKSNAGWVGFIVRDDSWNKDPDGDRTVDVSQFVGGEINVYLESGKAEFTVDDTNVVKGAKVKTAVYENDTIVVTTSMEVENPAEAFTVICEETEVAIKSVEKTAENTYVLTFEEGLDLTKAYNVVFNGNTFDVSMPSIYKTESFINDYTYNGDDLGATWTAEKTTFKVWAPLASEAKVYLYDNGKAGEGTRIAEIAMEKADKGVWVAEVEGDLNGTYYTYYVNNAGEKSEACDPYAVTTGVNGDRAMVIDLDSTDPEGWENDENPNAIGPNNFTDAVIYELHVRDASIDESSGVSAANKGNFLGLTEHGDNTILDHMVDLGVTHVHLLPVYDINSVNEETDGFNWGYDPKNYNVPEGSYSSDPYNGDVRVKEMKEMVQTLHENGISVIMDVVYNHVADAGNYCFNKIVPNYFSRMNENGGYNSNSGCGNDTASEHVMVRKYIVDSIKYWAEEYHIDGFRFDLVGLIDTITINELMKEVWSENPNVVFYGEGWEMNSYDTGVSMTIQNNANEVPGFAFFNDTFRDAVKGSVFDNTLPGWVSGQDGLEETIEQSFMGASIWGSAQTVCPTPLQTINYTSCHDNNTLYDRLKLTWPEASEDVIIKMNNLAAAYTITSQGVPFIHAAEDFLRSKPLADGSGYDHNSYASGDEINSIKWNMLEDEATRDVYEYYKGLIAFRKDHAALRMTDAEDVTASITAIDGLDANVVAFAIDGTIANDDDLFVIFNPNEEATTVALPEGNWDVYVDVDDAGTDVLATVDTEVEVDAISTMVLVKAEETDEPGTDKPETDKPGTDKPETDKPETENKVEGAVPEGAVLDVDVLSKADADKVIARVDKKHDKFMKSVTIEQVLDLSLVKGTTEVQPNGTVKVTLKLNDALKAVLASGKNLGVIYIADNGTITKIASTVKDGYISFNTTHFSDYAIFSYEGTQAPATQTGDNNSAVTWMLVMMIGAVVTVGAVKSKKVR